MPAEENLYDEPEPSKTILYDEPEPNKTILYDKTEPNKTTLYNESEPNKTFVRQIETKVKSIRELIDEMDYLVRLHDKREPVIEKFIDNKLLAEEDYDYDETWLPRKKISTRRKNRKNIKQNSLQKAKSITADESYLFL